MSNYVVGERPAPFVLTIPVNCTGKMAEYFQTYFTEEFIMDYLFIELCKLYKAVQELEDC